MIRDNLKIEELNIAKEILFQLLNEKIKLNSK